jgi:AhpD family alkylhydroperoxidase
MTRITEPSKKYPLLRASYFASKRELGQVPGSIKVLGHHAKLLLGYIQMELMVKLSTHIDPKLANLCQARAAALIGCAFCIDLSSAKCRESGATEGQLQSLADYQSSPHFSILERACLRYVDAMTQTPVDVPDELFNGLSALLDKKELVELTALIAWQNFRSRFDHAFGLESQGFLNQRISQ